MPGQVKVGVGLYILNNRNQLLLGLRRGAHGAGTWCAPGGHLEFGESFEQAAVREALEETGLKIAPDTVKVAGVTNDIFSAENKHYITVQLVTECPVNAAPHLTEPEKCSEWRWFDLDNLPENLFIPTRNFLRNHNLSPSFIVDGRRSSFQHSGYGPEFRRRFR